MSAALIERLIEAGTPAALVAEVAVELARAQAAVEVLESRKAKDRERKRGSTEFHGTPRNSTEGAEIRPEVSLDKKPPQTPEKIKPIPCVSGKARARGYHRLPEGWQPSRPFPAALQAKLDQWPPGARDDEIATFKRWAANAADQAGKGRKLDWDKALWNWLGRRHDEHYGKIAHIGQRQSSWGQARDLVRAQPS